MKFKSDIEVQAGLKDSSGSNGSSGQVLSSDGATVSWVNAGGGVASDVQNEVKAGVAINKGQAVYVTGADGTNIIVGLASNTSEATSSKTLGLLNATVAVNGFADVVQIGKLAGLNTIGANTGDPVWLGINGNLIYGLANKPYAPAHLVFIGIVTRVNANNGEIFVTVQNGFELKEIHDVDIITNVPINGDVLGYDGTLWVNKTIAEWLGYTPVPNTRALTINGNTQNLTADRTWTIDIGINGSGTVNTLSKFTGTTTIGDSQIKDSGTSVSIGYTTNPNSYKLDVNGDVNINTDLYVSGTFPYTIKAAGGVNVDDALGVYWKTDVGGIGGTLAGIGQSSSGLDFYTNSSFLAPKLRILANGNVTIGTLAGSGSRMVVADATGVLSTQAIPPSGVTSFNTRTGAITLTSGDVTTALGYTPVTDARTITINGVTQDLAANRSWTVTAPETDTLQTVTGRGNTTTNGLIATASESREVSTYLPGSYTTNDLVSGTNYKWYSDIWRLGATRSSGASAADFVVQLNATNKMNLSVGGSLSVPGDMRAPIFYDSDNTGYYLNPASLSNLNQITANGTLNVAGSNAQFWTATGGGYQRVDARDDSTGARAHWYGVLNNGATSNFKHAWYDGTAYFVVTAESAFINFTRSGGGNITTDGSFRAPVFYDLNNTAYYADFNSTGTSINIAGSLNAATYNAPAILVNSSGTGSAGSAIGMQQVTAEGWTGIFVDFEPNTGWGLYHDNPSNYFLITAETTTGSIGSNVVPSRYSGNRTAHTKFQFQQTDAVGIAGGSWRAPVFYDFNDTAYYIDPNSTTTSIQVAGAIEQGNNLSRPLVQWGVSGNTTGAVVIKLPGTSGSNYGMIHAVIDIYEYNGNNVCTVIIGGHNWSTQWYNMGAQVIGKTNKQVRLAVKDGKYCIVLGDGSSVWEYGQVVLRKIQNGSYYNNIMDLGGVYSIGIESDTYSWVSSDLRRLDSQVIIASSQTQSPIYYDYNNTGYYCDPASTSNLYYVNATSGLSLFGGYGSGSGPGLNFENAGSFARLAFWGLDFYDWNHGTQMVIDNGYVTANNSFRAPIFYDSNDTAFYLDPSGSSIIRSYSSTKYQINVPGAYDGSYEWVSIDIGRFNAGGSSLELSISRSISDPGPYGGCTSRFIIHSREWHSGQDNYWGYYTEHGGASGASFPNGYYISHAGPRDLAGGGYKFFMRLLKGTRYLLSASGDMNYTDASIGNPVYGVSDPGGVPVLKLGMSVNGANSTYNKIFSGNTIDADGIISSAADMRAPIYYDSNNTGYYVDPSNISVLNSAQFGDNSNGNQGIGIYYGNSTGGYGRIRFYQASDNHQTIHSFSANWQGGGFGSGNSANAINIDGAAGVTFGGWNVPDAYIAKGGNFWCRYDVIAYSDARVKDNVEVITDALDKISKVRGVTFTRNDYEDKEKRHTGVIAQEMLEALPEAVTKDSDGMYSVSYGNLAGLFIEAIKEQQTQIEELKELVNKLINK